MTKAPLIQLTSIGLWLQLDGVHAPYQALAVPDFDRHLAAGQIELLPGTEWHLDGGQFDLQGLTGGWSEKLSGALAKTRLQK